MAGRTATRFGPAEDRITIALERGAGASDTGLTEAERTRELLARELISIEAYDRARMELRVAESALASARDGARVREAELEAAHIRLTQPGAASDAAATVDVVAPVAGKVLRVAQESESVIAAGAEVMSIGDPGKIEVVVEMLSTDAVQVQPGADVIIENWGRSGTPLQGRVRLVEPYGFLKISALGVEEQRVNVIVDFVGPPSEWSSLGHGYRVEAAIVTWQDDEVVQAPVAALFRRRGEWAVFRVNANQAKLTAVELGRDNGRNAQILSGIEPGETVVLYPGEQVEDGVRVRRRSE
jgi:HlyD family secretion protein